MTQLFKKISNAGNCKKKDENKTTIITQVSISTLNIRKLDVKLGKPFPITANTLEKFKKKWKNWIFFLK